MDDTAPGDHPPSPVRSGNDVTVQFSGLQESDPGCETGKIPPPLTRLPPFEKGGLGGISDQARPQLIEETYTPEMETIKCP